MIVGLKDGAKLVGIAIVCFCAVFVCTFMLNFYLDVLPLRDSMSEELMPLYQAQLAAAQFCSAITGGVLGLIAAVMLLFYLRLYIETHAAQLGVLKALGYPCARICVQFWVFGLSALIGCAAGYGGGWAVMRLIYDTMTIEGIGELVPQFHLGTLLALVAAPTAVLTAIACLYPYFVLRRPPLELLRGRNKQSKEKTSVEKKDRPFLREMCFATVRSKKLLAFFVAFSCFCFATMVQMAFSMEELSSKTMGYMILGIGLVLAAVTAIMAITSLLRANAKNLSLMKAFGYSLFQRILGVLGGFVPIALLGFAVGTLYQHGLLILMVNIVFADVEGTPAYSFNVPVFFLTLALFLVCYCALAALYIVKINKVSVKDIMLAE